MIPFRGTYRCEARVSNSLESVGWRRQATGRGTAVQAKESNSWIDPRSSVDESNRYSDSTVDVSFWCRPAHM